MVIAAALKATGLLHYMIYIMKHINAPLADSKAVCDGHSIDAMITSSNFALSAKVCYLHNSKTVL